MSNLNVPPRGQVFTFFIKIQLFLLDIYCSFLIHTAQKMKFSIKDFFSKCDQVSLFGHIYWRNPE